MTIRTKPLLLILALLIAVGCSDDGGNPVDGGSGPPNVTIQASQDNTLYEDTGGALSNGSGNFMFAGRTEGFQPNNQDPPEVRRAVIKFDVAASGIPSGATIDSVFLRLEMSKTKSSGRVIRLHRLLADWGEGTSASILPNEGGGADAAPGDATWLHTFFPNSLWTSAGGDFVSTPSDSALVGGISSYTWGSSARMVADVQGWLDTPGNNFGWILIGDEVGTGTAKRFNTRENPSAATRPRLQIFYTEP